MAAEETASGGRAVQARARSDFELIALWPEQRREALFNVLGPRGVAWLARDWRCRARPSQLAPSGEWKTWLVMAGRGFGKTRMGAEWVRDIAERVPTARIALVGATLHDARTVMVEGESGLLAICAGAMRPSWQPSRRQLIWPNGARAFLFGAAEPEALRGPQHSHGWADEIGRWGNGVAAWDNLAMGMRLGERPQMIATTTPRPVPLVRLLIEREDVVVTRGRTDDNRAALAPGFLAQMEAAYGGTRLGRQELEGELLLDHEGALWTRDLLERCRESGGRRERPTRILVGVDPCASQRGDACGIVVAGIDGQGLATVLEDATVSEASPERWARAVADVAARWQADRVIAEANNGGDMVRAVLRAADIALPVRLVHAAQGKSARAEPVAALYEAGRVRHRGAFPALEDQLCGLLRGGGYEGPGRSPDRADALVWALTELMDGARRRARVQPL